MLEKRVLIFKDKYNNQWYTLQTRRVYFLFRSKWVTRIPMYLSSYEAAINLLNVDKKK